jgi:hypothetical protein
MIQDLDAIGIALNLLSGDPYIVGSLEALPGHAGGTARGLFEAA